MNQLNSLRNVEVISNNVANANTSGFKTDKVLFSRYMVDDVNDKTSFPKAHSTLIDFAEGGLKTTSRPLDVAIAGPGFFVIKTPIGIRYSRSGAFKIDGEGALINSSGHKVVSFDGQEIVFEEEDTEPLIGEDGTIFVGTQERGVIGLVEFDNPNLLRKMGNNLFVSDAAPKVAERSRIMQGVVEDSNVNSIAEINRLAELQRELALSTHMINESYSLQRSTFKVYSRNGG